MYINLCPSLILFDVKLYLYLTKKKGHMKTNELLDLKDGLKAAKGKDINNGK